MSVPSSFDLATIDGLARLLGEHYTGSTLTRLFEQAVVEDQLGKRTTKWKRIDAALGARQRRDGHAGGVAAFLHASLTPKCFSGQREIYDDLRADVNEMLALEGLTLCDDGRLHRVTQARTLSEAEQRADRLPRAIARARRSPRCLALLPGRARTAQLLPRGARGQQERVSEDPRSYRPDQRRQQARQRGLHAR